MGWGWVCPPGSGALQSVSHASPWNKREKGCDLPKVMSQWRARNSSQSPESAQQLLTCRHLAGKGSQGAAGSIPIPGESWHGNNAQLSLPLCLPELICIIIFLDGISIFSLFCRYHFRRATRLECIPQGKGWMGWDWDQLAPCRGP